MVEAKPEKSKRFQILVKSPVVTIIIFGIVVLILYYIMSPYKNCMRDNDQEYGVFTLPYSEVIEKKEYYKETRSIDTSVFCTLNTSW